LDHPGRAGQRASFGSPLGQQAVDGGRLSFRHGILAVHSEARGLRNAVVDCSGCPVNDIADRVAVAYTDAD
jgi:hypothetical protein